MIYILILLIRIKKNAKKNIFVVLKNNCFFNRKRILAASYFENQMGIVWDIQQKKNDFLIKTHHTLPLVNFGVLIFDSDLPKTVNVTFFFLWFGDDIPSMRCKFNSESEKYDKWQPDLGKSLVISGA